MRKNYGSNRKEEGGRVPTEWFVEPFDKFTNDAIAAYLTESGKSGDESAMVAMPDENAIIHQVWRMEYRQITRLVDSQNDIPLKFRVFNKRQNARNIREYPFLCPAVKRKLAEKRLQSQIKGLKKTLPKKGE